MNDFLLQAGADCLGALAATGFIAASVWVVKKVRQRCTERAVRAADCETSVGTSSTGVPREMAQIAQGPASSAAPPPAGAQTVNPASTEDTR
ncbi:hypothetical protein KNE206_30370 [Kitasatospora sp. NE20-6]